MDVAYDITITMDIFKTKHANFSRHCKVNNTVSYLQTENELTITLVHCNLQLVMYALKILYENNISII